MHEDKKVKLKYKDYFVTKSDGKKLFQYIVEEMIGCNSNWKLFARKELLLLVIVALMASCSSGGSSATMENTKKPEMNRFIPVQLGGKGVLDEPMAFDVAKDGKVYIIERKGGIKMYNPQTDAFQDVGTIPVNHIYTNYEGQKRQAEEGGMGLILDPGFEQNGWIYVLYADLHTAKHNLSRFTIVNDTLNLQSEEKLLNYHVQRNYCCHTGGGMEWDSDGNLYVAIGSNTENEDSSYTDQRWGFERRDDQRAAANTNDLRGKIIRIHPEDDGTYTIPKGNLFPPGLKATRPEIYTMGLRNPWRLSVDSKTGWLYWSEVGPPFGKYGLAFDEFNQARGPGFFGWPYFVGPNGGVPIANHITGTVGNSKDPQHPTNTSRNNTGLINLPPAQPAFIWYPPGPSKKFPKLGTGSHSASGNRVYHRKDYLNAKDPYPAYYEGKFFMTDFVRGWIMVVTMDENGDYQSMEQFLPDYHPIEPIDMDFGPDGQLYVLEYGRNWFHHSLSSKLVRIEYNSGNRAPEVRATTSARGGRVPLEVDFTSEGTQDPDGDSLNYQWKITNESGVTVNTYDEANPTVSFNSPGTYTATLTASDEGGLSDSSSVNIVAGNAPPEVSLNIVSGNQTFFFPDDPVSYSVSVTDFEDGSLAKGEISPQDVSISVDYASAGFDFVGVQHEQSNIDTDNLHYVGRKLIEANDCLTCHQINSMSAGPAYTAVAKKYTGQSGSEDYLANKVIKGGSGVWGERQMPPHPMLTQSDAHKIIEYILDLNDHSRASLPARGSFTPTIPEGDTTATGGYILRAAYRDKGASGAPSIATQAVVVLRSSAVNVSQADVLKYVEIQTPSRSFGGSAPRIRPKSDSYIGFENVDLTGVCQLAVNATVNTKNGQLGGTIQIRIGSPDGRLLGQVEVAALQHKSGFGRQTPPKVIPLGNKISGVHNIYILFSNEAASDIASLMTVSTIRFMNTKGPVETGEN